MTYHQFSIIVGIHHHFLNMSFWNSFRMFLDSKSLKTCRRLKKSLRRWLRQPGAAQLSLAVSVSHRGDRNRAILVVKIMINHDKPSNLRMAHFQRTLYINIYIYIYLMCCVLVITSSYHPVQLTNCVYLHFLLTILNPQSLGHHLPKLVTCGIPD